MGAAAVGTTISVYAIARLMMNLPAGILADRYGRKPLLVWGPLITAFGERFPLLVTACIQDACARCLALCCLFISRKISSRLWRSHIQVHPLLHASTKRSAAAWHFPVL